MNESANGDQRNELPAAILENKDGGIKRNHSDAHTLRDDSVTTKAATVSTEQSGLEWLGAVINPLSSKPSPQLEKFFLVGNRNVVDQLVKRASIILAAIFPENESVEMFPVVKGVGQVKGLWSELKTDALKLYFSVLECIFVSESRKLNTKDLGVLLGNEKFHRSMLACSAEVVWAAKTGKSLLFPVSKVLERTGVTAFDLTKVMESFVKHETLLPRDLRRHLNSLQELLLERMVWGKGSSLYDSLILARPEFSDDIRNLGLLSDPLPSLDEISMRIQAFPSLSRDLHGEGQDAISRAPRRVHKKPTSEVKSLSAAFVKDSPPASCILKAQLPPPSPSLQAAFTSPRQQKLQSEGCGRVDPSITVLFDKEVNSLPPAVGASNDVLKLFFLHRVAKLAAFRAGNMAETLKLSQQIKERIFFLFQQILNEETTLLFNRHIDQIIVCCFYLVLENSKSGMTLTEIKDSYMVQPQHRPEVLESVVDSSLMHQTDKRSDNRVEITVFYERTFLPKARPLLDRIVYLAAWRQVNEVNDQAHFPVTPSKSPFRSFHAVSPMKISPSHNIYLSPMQKCKKHTLNAHAGKSYYAFVGQSTDAYTSPSKDLAAINNSLNSCKKARVKLNFISDSMVAETLFPLLQPKASGATSTKADQIEV